MRFGIRLSRSVALKLMIFGTVGIVLIGIVFFHYGKVPAEYFGIGRYTVVAKLPQTGGLYASSEVTYRGVEVGKVKAVRLTGTGVEAVLSLKSGIPIPSDLKAEVHSASAIGEQYLELLPRNGSSAALKNGSVIAQKDTSIPPDINNVLDDLVTDVKAVPHENLKTVVDEAYTAVGGLGPQLSNIIKGGSTLAIDARKNLDPLVALIDQSKPVLDSQSDTSRAIAAWASNLATVTSELQHSDPAVASLLENTPPALDETLQLVDRLQPTLPRLLANVDSLAKVALDYRDDLETTLVMMPQVTADVWGAIIANADTKQPYRGAYMSFNLNLFLPPTCSTGYLPASQQRAPTFEDAPERPGVLYCRTPQDSPFHVRGARNFPCETVPGKRAALVTDCESKEPYVPLNDGLAWKGDPNATTTGQSVPQPVPGAPAPAGQPSSSLAAGLGSMPPLAAAEYDPATGNYTGADGKQYTRSDLDQTASKNKTWQSLLTPPTSDSSSSRTATSGGG